MMKGIACIRSETLAELQSHHQIRDRLSLTLCATVQDIFDRLWEVGGEFDIVVIDGADVDVHDLLVAARNWPGTEFILHDCTTTASYLKRPNIVDLGTLKMLRDHTASRCERSPARQGGLS